MSDPLDTYPGPIPPRLAADCRHPWFHPHWSRNVEVLLAGIRVQQVIAADTVEGWAELTLQPFRVVDDRVATARFRGEVQFVPREGADG
jgi:hypothetical protein